MGKKKSRSKHKNFNRPQQISNGEAQDSTSSITEANNQSCDCDTMKVYITNLANEQEVDTELGSESQEGNSIVGKSNPKTKSECVENTSNEINGPLEGSTPSGTDCLDQNSTSINSEPLISNSTKNLYGEEKSKTTQENMCHTEDEDKNSMENSGAEKELLKSDAGNNSNAQNKNDDLTVLVMENNQTSEAVDGHSFPSDESNFIKEKNDSFPHKSPLSSENRCLVELLVTEAVSVPQSEGPSEKAKETPLRESTAVLIPSSPTSTQHISNFPATKPDYHHQLDENNDTSSSLRPSDEKCSKTSAKELSHNTQPNEDKKDKEIDGIMEGMQCETMTIEKIAGLEVDSNSNNSVEYPKEIAHIDKTQQAKNYDTSVFLAFQENNSDMAKTEKAKYIDNTSLPSFELPGGEKVSRSKDSKGENLQKGENSDLMVTMGSYEKAEPIDRQASQDSKDENLQKGENSDLMVTMGSNEKVEAIDRQARQDSKDENLQKVENSDLMVTMGSNEKVEAIDRPAGQDSKGENLQKLENSDLMVTMGSNEKVESIDIQSKEVASLGTMMNLLILNHEEMHTTGGDKKYSNLKCTMKKQKQMKAASTIETVGKGPGSCFAIVNQCGYPAEEYKTSGPTMGSNLPVKTLREQALQKEDVIPSDTNLIVHDCTRNISSRVDTGGVCDVNEVSKIKYEQCEQKVKQRSDIHFKDEIDLGANDKGPVLRSTTFGAKKKMGKDKKKGVGSKIEGKAGILEGNITPVSVGEQISVSATKTDAGAIKKHSGSVSTIVSGLGSLFANADDETFHARPIFMANTCHVCKSTHGGVTRLKSCSACRLIAYCSKEHQRRHWKEHKDLCQQVQKRIKKSGLHDLFGDAYKITDAEEWRKFRCLQIVNIENHMGRPLLPFEREMFLYPRVCSVCHKSDPEKLKVCKGCHFINYCTSEHLPISHKFWCTDLKLLLQLNQYQSRYGLIRPNIPHINLDCTKPFPKSMKEFFSISLLSEKNAAHFNLYETVLSDIATCPMTICYILNLLHDENQTNIYKKLTVHLIGAESQFEVEPLSKWDSFLLDLLPYITELHLVFIGPELVPTSLEEVADDSYQIQEIKVTNSSKKLTAEFYYGQLYHEYANSSSFIQPDIICAFNCGIYRFTGFNNKDTWGPTIKSMVKDMNIPILLTAYTEVEAPKDVARIKKQCGAKELIPPMKNPFASLRPNLNFVSDDETPLIYKNQYLSIIKGCN